MSTADHPTPVTPLPGQPFHPLTDRTLLELIQDAVVVFDPATEQVLEANTLACELYGYSYEEFLNLNLEEVSTNVIHGKQVLADLLADPDANRQIELTQLRKDKTPIVVQIQSRRTTWRGQDAIITLNRDITHYRRTQRELEQSEERFGRIFHASPAATMLISPSGWLMDANDSFFKLTGWQRGDIVGRNMHDFGIFPDDLVGVIQALADQQHLSDYETRVSTRAGDIRQCVSSYEWVELNGELVILAQLFDLTDRLRTENKLRESEARLRNLLTEEERRNREATLLNRVRSIIVHDMDQQAAIRTVVEGLHELYGYTHVSIYFVKEDGLHLQHQVGYENVLEVIPKGSGVSSRVVSTGKPVFVADVTKDPDFIAPVANIGSEICAPLFIQEAIIGTLNVETVQGHPLTETDLNLIVSLSEQLSLALHRTQLYESAMAQRELAENLARKNAALYSETLSYAEDLEIRVVERTTQYQQAKEQVEAVLNASGDGILLVNMQGIIKQCNPALANLLKSTSHALLGLNFFNMLDHSTRDLLVQSVQQVMNTGEQHRVDVLLHAYDSEKITAEAIIDELKTSSWGETLVVISVRDVTAQHKLETELREALDKERQLVELKSRFASMASHEFRTPLALIRSSADLLRMYYDRMSTERREISFDTIIGQVRQLTMLIDDLLLISRADTLGSEYNPRPTDIVRLCQNITDEIQMLALTHTIRFTGPDNLPPVMLDPDLLRRAVSNLLVNAIKYSPDDTLVNFSLAHEVHSSHGTLIIRVQDYGIGIPRASLRNLFSTFFRAPNARDIPGTGLGLAIVKRAIDAHRGTVTAHSQENVGTTFIIRLPAVPAPPPDEDA
ncbi:MAG: PAS domain S-box protein [Pleurocapsa minor GSE-CHR-MK-17-07R]|jgi:PAS domain S-box-containing protein|nr:PAS domain S-box protein [Pleurocapsa minor GSE-CHR-MK 17-07R]